MQTCQYQKLRAGEVAIFHEPPTDPNPEGNAHTSQQPPDPDTMLTSSQTRAFCGRVSAMCLWRWQRDSRVNFPQPIRINSRNYWRLGDLRAWLAVVAAKSATARRPPNPPHPERSSSPTG